MTLPVMIINAYNEYVSVGYPADTAIYILRMAPKTLDRMGKYFKRKVSFIPPAGVDVPGKKIFFGEHQFRIEMEHTLGMGQIIFGPELIRIKWTGR